MKTTIITVLTFLVCINSADAQILERVINRTKEKTKNKTEQKTDETIDKGLNKIEEGIGSIFKKKETNSTTPPSGPSSNKSNASNSETDYSQYKGSSFIPGKNVLFFEDFATARLGTGSANWHMYEYDPSADFERPNVRTIQAASGNWLKMPRKGFVFPNSFKNLPEHFTIEYDLYADPNKMNEMEGGFKVNFIATENRQDFSVHFPSEPAIRLDVHPHGSTEVVYISASTEYNGNLTREEMVLFEKVYNSGWNSGRVNRVSVSRNGKQVALYLNGKEMLNLANGLPKKANYSLIFDTNLWGDGMYVSNIRIAGDVPNAVRDLSAAGKFVTNAIYFDVNSSRIKPESWATLNNTAQAIKTTSGNILIVGHTDSDGADDANLKLSQSRAASVKNALVKEFGIDASRLITDGKGEVQPVTSNNTASGKAQNRRVEFIKR
jgi:outer membrane protein OmpA-like peptidoglycan-associated protein